MNKYIYTISEAEQGKPARRVRLRCLHEDTWPPAEAYLPESPIRLRQEKLITDHAYQAIQVWQDKCGKKAMDDDCAKCPLSRANARVKARGTGRITLKEIEFAALMATSRTDVALVYERESPMRKAKPQNTEPENDPGGPDVPGSDDPVGLGPKIDPSAADTTPEGQPPDPTTDPEPDGTGEDSTQEPEPDANTEPDGSD